MTSPAPRYFDRRTAPHISTLILLAGLSALSMNMFLPALPIMADAFGTEYRIMQLAVSLYLALVGVLQLIVGPLSDRFGRRPVMLAGVGLFVIATTACALAPTVEVFLLARMGQATIVVGLVLARAIVRDVVTQDQAASMIGYVTMGMSVVPMIGPALGGLAADTLGWQAIFWAMAVIGGTTLYVTWNDLGETNTGVHHSFREQVKEYPQLFTSPRFWGYCMASAFASGCFFAYLGGAPYVGTEVFGLSPARLGLYFATPAVGYFAGNWMSGRYSAQIGVNRMVGVGTAATLGGMLLALGIYEVGFATAEIFFGSMIVIGLGNGMVIPNATAGMLSVRPHLAGTASGLGGAIMVGGGAAFSAVATAILKPGSDATPLLLMMVLSAALSVASIQFVMWRGRTLQNRLG